MFFNQSMITPYNILRHELIGLKVKVFGITHPGYQCEGKIVDETKNTLKIKSKKETKILPKNSIVLEIKLPEEAIVRVDGKLLMARSEDRIKKKYRLKFV